MLGGSVDSDITYMPALIFIAFLGVVAYLTSNEKPNFWTDTNKRSFRQSFPDISENLFTGTSLYLTGIKLVNPLFSLFCPELVYFFAAESIQAFE